jgi:hypothetical protein
MALDSHWKVMYGNAIKALAGSQKRSLLKELVDKDSKKGETVYFDMDDVDDDATLTAMSANGGKYRRGATDANSLTLAEMNAVATPHMDIIKNRTQCVPNLNEWGHEFANIDEIAENANHNSRRLGQGMRKIWKNQDLEIFEALTKQAEDRGKAGGSSETFPTGQQFDITTGLGLTDISNICKLYEDNYADDEPPVLIISPTQKKYLIDNSGGTIHSKDFVSAKNFFESGELPEIYGVHLLVHPGVTTYKDTITTALTTKTDSVVAFQKSAIIYNQFEALKHNMAQLPTRRFQYNLYLHEHIGACRVDDKRVVQCVIGS